MPRPKYRFSNGYAPEWMKRDYGKLNGKKLPALETLRELPAYTYRETIAPHLVHYVDALILTAQREGLQRLGFSGIARKFGISPANADLLIKVRAKKLGVELNLKKGGPNRVGRRKKHA